MTSLKTHSPLIKGRTVIVVPIFLAVIGLTAFMVQLTGANPDRAWQAYLINFLLWSAVAQGGLLFSTVTHVTKARWSKPIQDIAESFVAFFPFSLALFLLLFLGRESIFPWLHHELHGKESWLNIPFLFSRDLIGLLVLYGLGMAYVYYALRLRLVATLEEGRLRTFFLRKWTGSEQEQ